MTETDCAAPNASRNPAGSAVRVSVIVLPVCFSVVWLLLGARSLDIARRHDFLNLYTGASLAWQGRFAELHHQDTQLRREQNLVPETKELVPFVRPAVYALLISPLAALPYSAAFWVWLGLQVAAAAVAASRLGSNRARLRRVLAGVPGLLALVLGLFLIDAAAAFSRRYRLRRLRRHSRRSA